MSLFLFLFLCIFSSTDLSTFLTRKKNIAARGLICAIDHMNLEDPGRRPLALGRDYIRASSSAPAPSHICVRRLPAKKKKKYNRKKSRVVVVVVSFAVVPRPVKDVLFFVQRWPSADTVLHYYYFQCRDYSTLHCAMDLFVRLL